MDSGISPGEVGGTLAGAIAILYSIGKGVAWLLNWQEARDNSRAARLKAWEDSLDRREKEQREEQESRFQRMEMKVSAMSSVMFELCAELQRLDPSSPALARARMFLQRAYPIEHETPEEIRNLLRRLDGKTD